MEKEAAVQKIFDEVYIPVFLEKLASHGVRLKDQDEVNSALTTAAMLKYAAANQPAAPVQPSIVKQAALDLAELLSPVQTKIDPSIAEALNTI